MPGPDTTTTHWIKRLATLIHEIRPDWAEPGIASAIAKVADRPLADVAVAAIKAATTRTDQRTPAIIGMGGSHWSQDANSSNGGNSYRPTAANTPSCDNCGYPEHLHPQLNNGPWRNAPCTFTRRTNDRRY